MSVTINTKKLAGEKAVEYVEDGMLVGLGTGSTVYFTIVKLGEMVKNGLKIKGIPTSIRTENLARELGIPLISFADTDTLDVCIDGADELNAKLELVKGGGGALLREKLVAAASRKFIVVADATKKVATLGKFPLPVEIVQFAWETTFRRVDALGIAPAMRMSEGRPYVTDNGNYILDCACGAIADAPALNRQLKMMPGVVETGLFIEMADVAIVAGESDIEVLSKP
jgi:ribose 5-phosphate isomerase A